ncbi:helix-turn-helix transcriptional regulator [Alicyclobacillus mengziensis]|uniref:Helix-turn-helix transcriptional regulator n=1 Tax=Alicyclobacillus mengziensis TaxID=2931921 RepID=A0A9X7Z750_9BACL|nr:helix-turn-helix transcriptional regulator [Alicyclobacillus mengziensis]QSO48679.1 helix-turn-helix transcriptional regulator [Alicyclobacillus mengziensis]
MDRQPRTWLIRLRHQRRMSQQQIAMRARISRNYLSEIECGVKNPSVDVSKRIAQVVGCEWIQFF